MPRQLIRIPAISPDIQDAIKHERAYIGMTLGTMKIDTRAATASDPAEMCIYGMIGDPFDGADSATFGRFMRANRGKPINVRINSGGGLAYDGITIHNAILQHDAPVTTIIEGMAGSAASIIAVAGSTVQMFQNATFFIHRAEVFAQGNADVMKEAFSWLDKIDQQIVDTYKARTGRPPSMIMKEMIGAKGNGTEFSAAEALAGKYIDKIMTLKRGAAAAETEARPSLKSDGERLKSIARMRDQRIHSRRGDFTPEPEKAVVAQAGFTFDLGNGVSLNLLESQREHLAKQLSGKGGE